MLRGAALLLGAASWAQAENVTSAAALTQPRRHPPLPPDPAPPAPRLSGAGWSHHEIESGGERREFSAYEPTGTVTGLMIFLHGLGSNKDSWCNGAAAESYADQLGFVAICPNAIQFGGQRCWRAFPGGGYCQRPANEASTADVDFVEYLINWAKARKSIPAGRTYLQGCSNGGSMSHRMACERADAIDGIIVTAQTWFDPWQGWDNTGLSGRCNPSKKVPIYNAVGDRDNFYRHNFESQWRAYTTGVLGATGSPSQVWSSPSGDRYCDEYASGAAASRLCTYLGVGHSCNQIAGTDHTLRSTHEGFHYLMDANSHPSNRTVQ